MNQKIKDDARLEVAKTIWLDGDECIEGTVTDVVWREMPLAIKEKWLKRADQILSLSGETDEVCSQCNGGGRLVAGSQRNYFKMCPKCKGTGHKLWGLKLVVDGKIV